MKINLKSLFFSGIIAGMIIMIVGGGLVPIIGHQMDEVLKSRLLPPLSCGAMAFFVFVSIANGIGITALYALINNSIKSRLKAVVITSLTFWFFGYFLSGGALVAYGFMPLGLTVIGTAWGILELTAGTFAVSILYKSN